MRACSRHIRLILAVVALAGSGCRRSPPAPAAEKDLPPAYMSNQITDPALRGIAERIKKWALEQKGADRKPLYSRAEILPPARTVQPYGVGAYQQEPRLPVVLITGEGWPGLKNADKEAKVKEAFEEIEKQLRTLERQPPLRPTLTIQTPQGMELGWINHLDASGKNLHGDE